VVTIEALKSGKRVEAGLAALLIEAVADNAGVSFLHPLSPEKARGFWRKALECASRGERIVFGAYDGDDLVGSVTLDLDTPENQPHRGDIAKMMVAMRARRRGIAHALLRAAESAAHQAGRTLLVLDTEPGSKARPLYEKLGWQRVGEIPDYALHSDRSGFTATVLYYKRV
jgi:ribosomal protein S18 acetylase RimI-like enzyme